jgi:hypothetical protein
MIAKTFLSAKTFRAHGTNFFRQEKSFRDQRGMPLCLFLVGLRAAGCGLAWESRAGDPAAEDPDGPLELDPAGLAPALVAAVRISAPIAQ